MPPRSPLPQRHGLDAAWLRTPDRDPADPTPWPTMGEWLETKLGAFLSVADFLRDERFVYYSGKPVRGDDVYDANTFVWFHRDLREEAPVPGTIHVVHRDERIIVIDKPPFLSTIPRGRHVLQSVVVKLRHELGLPELAPAHRLDRLTSGLLILTTNRRWRSAYQMLFQERVAHKTYLARAAFDPSLEFPVTVANHLRKEHGSRRVQLIEHVEPNAWSRIELDRVLGDEAVYRLTPLTGKTHQLRQHMLTLGLPISGDPLYPELLPVSIDDFSTPLQLLAHSLSFTDPIDGKERHFESVRDFPVQTPLGDSETVIVH